MNVRVLVGGLVVGLALACGAPGGNDGGSGGSGGSGGGGGGSGGGGGGSSGCDAGAPSTHDAGNPDAGTGACAAMFAGCSAYTDRTLVCDARAINFDFSVTPQCLRIKAGQTVTFNNVGASHPLSQSCGPVNAVGQTITAGPVRVTFTTAGDYGYFCENHGTPGGGQMAGSIRVDP